MMNDSMDETPELRPAETPVLGRRLTEAREAQGLSIEDVSNRLRLSTRQIRALEEDDFTVLPEAMITRGFIRNYARLLELDPEPLLEAYRAQVPSEPPRAISISSANIPISDSDRRPWVLYLLGVVLILVLLGAWLYAENHPESTATPVEDAAPIADDSGSVADAPVTEPMPVPALPLGERMAEGASASGEEPASEPDASQVAVDDGETRVGTGDASVVPVGQGTLEMSFSDTSWISVIDGNNQEIVNKTKSAGSREVVQGKPPFKVVVGNAAASTVAYNGKTVDLEPHTRLNVARITLE
jgi:cytoskeleton protein RodZ